MHREADELASLGFHATEIDLRDGPAAVERLPEADVIWVRGGNVFALRRALGAWVSNLNRWFRQ